MRTDFQFPGVTPIRFSLDSRHLSIFPQGLQQRAVLRQRVGLVSQAINRLYFFFFEVSFSKGLPDLEPADQISHHATRFLVPDRPLF